MKALIISLVSLTMLAGCASSTKKLTLATSTGYLCPGKALAKKSEFPNQGGVIGKDKKECIQIPEDNDQSWDYQVRDYERDDLPSMP